MGATDPGLFILKGALRAAIVVPLAFALALVAIGSKQMALFAAFGSMSLLVFVDFGGIRRARLRAYLLLLAAGAVLIALGTLCSRSVWLATVVMGLVAFAILFAGVLDDYIAASRAAAILTFVLGVMVPADAAAIPTRLAGWGLAGALCIPAALLLWPGRPRDRLRHEAAQAARTLAELVQARSRGEHAGVAAAAQAAHERTVALRDRFVSMAQRPSGTSGSTAALARLIEDLGWLNRVAARVPELGDGSVHCAAERAEIEAAAPAALRAVAARLDRAPSSSAETLDLTRLRAAHEAFGRAQLAHFEAMRPDRDEAEATSELDDAYRLRELSFGTLLLGRDAVQACHGRADACAGAFAGVVPGIAVDPTSTSTSASTFISTQRSRARDGATGRLLRTHASRDSVWLRNSVRGAVGLAIAVLVAQLTDLQHGFWIVLGTMSVLRSSAVSTSATVVWALLGTLAGIVVGGLVVLLLGGTPGALWAVLPFAVLLAAYAPAISFAAGQAAFTVVVLVLFNLIQPAGWKVGLVRVEDIAIGAAVSLLVGVLIWPRGATAILRGALGAAYVEAAHYLDVAIAALLGDSEEVRPGEAARAASDAAQLLDTALRDYLSARSSARGRLHDLTVLSTGAGRVRRVARLLENPHALIRLVPVGDEQPRLARARDAFEAQRRVRCDWYRSLGTAISQAEPAPRPEPGAAGAVGETEAARETEAAGATETVGATGTPGRAKERDIAAGGLVTLERSATAPGGDGLQPGLAIAWAQLHLDVLTAFESMLTEAYTHISDAAVGVESRP
ncbi:MAG TPA: FUSC family protein [Solirubrobacteraceae bacterium]